MKPGRLTCAGIVGIMLAVPHDFWKTTPPEVTVRVIVPERVAAAPLGPPRLDACVDAPRGQARRARKRCAGATSSSASGR